VGGLERKRGNGSWPPFQPGHMLSSKTRFWASPLLREADRAEVAEIAAGVAELMPSWHPSFALAVEGLACRIWRQRRAYADLSENGLVREDGKPAPVLHHLVSVENQIQRDLEALGLTPRAAAALGLDVASTRRQLSLIELHEAAAAERAEDDGGGEAA
jgi:hypothetical protein